MRTSMRGPFSGTAIHQLERLFQHGTAVGLSEGELLERFVQGHDESAFEALIARHGPMVLGVCRQLLRDPNDVDDAFQATFLVLVRKAGTLRRHDLLGNWLYGVAHRVAMRSRAGSARRMARAPFGTEAIDQSEAGNGYTNGDSVPNLDPEPILWLHEEVRRLPEKYRGPVLLCYFEGLTHEQAAARLGWPIGTVKGRMARARDLLRKRLNRRGVSLSPAALAANLAVPMACTTVSEALKNTTLNVARAIAGTTAGPIALNSTVSSPVATLADGVLRTMITTNVKAIALVLLVAGAVTTSFVIAAASDPTESGQPPAGGAAQKTANPASVKAQAKSTQSHSTPKDESESKLQQGPPAGTPGLMSQMNGGGGGYGGDSAEGGAIESNEGLYRLQIAELSVALPLWDKNPKNEVILKALDEPMTVHADSSPLREVLNKIKSSTAKASGSPIPIYVDPKGLAQAEATLDSVVTMDLAGVPLKTSLRLLLKQLGLAYCVRDGVLFISSVEGVKEELAEAVHELMGSDKYDQIDMRVLARTGLLGPGMGMGGTGMMSGGMGGRGMSMGLGGGMR
jgi:RNA polymerase sigma factor (sigma-70 family)